MSGCPSRLRGGEFPFSHILHMIKQTSVDPRPIAINPLCYVLVNTTKLIFTTRLVLPRRC